jgi:hypothetical protein
MNERFNNLRLDAGIAQLKDDPRLVVIDREGNVIDPLIGLGKFAELIIRECANICEEMAAKCAGLEGDGALAKDCAFWIKKDFGVEE